MQSQCKVLFFFAPLRASLCFSLILHWVSSCTERKKSIEVPISPKPIKATLSVKKKKKKKKEAAGYFSFGASPQSSSSPSRFLPSSSPSPPPLLLLSRLVSSSSFSSYSCLKALPCIQ